MRGDELVPILDGNVSGLEKLIVHEGVPDPGRLASLAMQFSGYAPSGGDRGAANNLMSQLLSGVTTTPSGLPAAEEFGPAIAASLAAMRIAWSSPSASEFSSSLDALVGSDRYSAGAGVKAGSGTFYPVMSALLDVFRGVPSTSLDGQGERQQYAWHLPARPIEGLVDRGSRIAGVDSAFDGTPRPIERERYAPNRIDVRIEALDARSFLDRKEDIAEAVRQAMLTSGAFGTAMNEY